MVICIFGSGFVWSWNLVYRALDTKTEIKAAPIHMIREPGK
jgi:hypothetical protein